MLCVDGGKDLWGLEQLSVELRIKICYHCDGYRCNVDIIFVRLVEENPTDNRKPVKKTLFLLEQPILGSVRARRQYKD